MIKLNYFPHNMPEARQVNMVCDVPLLYQFISTNLGLQLIATVMSNLMAKKKLS